MANQDADDETWKLFYYIGHRCHDVDGILKTHPHLANIKAQTQWANGEITPLIEAGYSGNYEDLSVILKHGGQVCATGHIYNMAHSNVVGQPMITAVDKGLGGYGACADIFPLFFAARRLNVPLVQQLIFAGADVNQTNAIGQSALHVASMADADSLQFFPFSTRLLPISGRVHWKVHEILIQHGADVNLRDSNNRTPLHYACQSRNEKVVKLLVKNGADVHVKDNDGFTALELAACQDYDMTKFLIKTCDFVIEDVINAYELVASVKPHRSSHPYATMLNATQLRVKHKIPKTIQAPKECYNFTEEWSSLEDLRQHRHDHHWLALQAILAKERILQGRYVVTGINHVTKRVFRHEMEKNPKGAMKLLNALFKHHLDLFRRNGEFLYFNEAFQSCYTSLDMYETFQSKYTCLKLIAEFGIAVKTDVLVDLFGISLDCCEVIRNKLEAEEREVVKTELASELERAFCIPWLVILHTLKRNSHNTVHYFENNLPKSLFKEIRKRFPLMSETMKPPDVTFSPLNFSRGVTFNPLNFFKSDFKSPFIYSLSFGCLSQELQLLKMFLNDGFPVNSIDYHGNTLLHIVITSWIAVNWFCKNKPDDNIEVIYEEMIRIISYLLESGIYIHATNAAEKTAMDYVKEIIYPEFVKENISKLMENYDQSLTLRYKAAMTIKELRLPYQNHLPSSIAYFVKLH